jgi:hypothetical protein
MPIINIIPTDKLPLDAWLLKLSGNFIVSGAGIAFLSAQITSREHRCIALRLRSNIHAGNKIKSNRVPHQNTKGGIWKQPLHKIARYISRIAKPQKTG